MKSLNLFVIITFLVSVTSTGQSRRELKEKFIQAESFVLYEEYNEALPGYQDLLEVSPDNYNYIYRIGQCYLNIPGEKHKAIKFLEQAVLNTDDRYREGSFRETQAPIDAYYYLANAYRINNKLDKALETYFEFKELIDPKIYDTTIINRQIKSCYNAKKLQKKPLYLKSKNLGESINTRFSDFNPVVSGDGSKMVYTRALQFFDGVFFSEKVDGAWSNPIDLTFQLGVDEDLYPCALSWDGTTLYLYKLDDYVGNIYKSNYSDGRWSRVEKLNENINDKYWESHASITKDGKTLFFTSNREKDTYGGLDIYKSVLDSTGNWGPAVNLGPVINTKYNEETPFITEDGQTLFFSSYGHFNSGGYDIFYSTLLDSAEWSKPLNMGYPINTPDDNLFYTPVKDGNFAYYSYFSNEGVGRRDIFYLEVFSEDHPRKFRISGIVSIENITWDIENVFKVYVVSRPSNDTVAVINPDPETGEYSIEIIAGDYELIYSGRNIEKKSELISLSPAQENDKIQIPEIELIPLDLVADFEMADTNYTATGIDTIPIELDTEINSQLIVKYYQDSILKKTDTILVKDSIFNYLAVPPSGKSRLELTLTDKFGNQTIKETEILSQQPVKEPVAEMIPEIKKEPPREVVELLENLKFLSTSNDIKAYLDSIDLRDLEISTSEELFRYLSQQPVQKSELEKLVTNGTNKRVIQIEDFRDFVVVNSEENISASIKKIDLQKEGINTPIELMEYLENKASGISDLTDKEVEAAFIADDIQNRELSVSLKESLSKYATGDIKALLDTLDISKTEVETPAKLYDYLLKQVEQEKTNKKELQLLFVSVAVNGDPEYETFYNKLREQSKGELKEFLKKLDPEDLEIIDAEDLINYLIQSSSSENFTKNEVIHQITEIISGSDLNDEKITKLISLEKEKSRNTKRRIVWGLSLILIVIIFFYIRRRRKNTE